MVKENLDKYINFVNGQVKFHTDRANAYAGTYRAKKHRDTSDEFLELKQFLLDCAELISKRKNMQELPLQLSLSLNPSELDSLPEELINELSISKADKFEYIVLTAMEEIGGFASLDQLLVALYKKTETVYKRIPLTNRLYRMMNKNILHSVPEKKGVYSLREFSPGELDEILNPAKQQEQIEN